MTRSCKRPSRRNGPCWAPVKHCCGGEPLRLHLHRQPRPTDRRRAESRPLTEATSIDDHTYRFARRAWQEGMPVIDDPISMIRCTNKVFLVELLGHNQVATPPTVIIELAQIA